MKNPYFIIELDISRIPDPLLQYLYGYFQGEVDRHGTTDYPDSGFYQAGLEKLSKEVRKRGIL